MATNEEITTSSTDENTGILCDKPFARDLHDTLTASRYDMSQRDDTTTSRDESSASCDEPTIPRDKTTAPRVERTTSRVENYEHVLMCLICRSDFDENEHQPKFLPCYHTFCKACLREYVAQKEGEDIECPSCRQVSTVPVAGVTALQTNFYIKHIQSLVNACNSSLAERQNTCAKHPEAVTLYYCKECAESICVTCCTYTCTDHDWQPLSVMTEKSHGRLYESFKRASALIHQKQTETKAQITNLSNSKDEALKSIDNAVEQHTRTLHRRGTLLKQNVIDIFNEHANQLEAALDDMETAMTCIVSTKEHQEEKMGRGLYAEIDNAVTDIEDVYENISAKVNICKSSVVFENQHGVDKFNMTAKSLGRVRLQKAETQTKSPSGPKSPLISPKAEKEESEPSDKGMVVRPKRFNSKQNDPEQEQE